MEDEKRSQDETQEDEPGTDSGTGQTVDPDLDDKDSGDREVDRDSKDSFPASDPPAW